MGMFSSVKDHDDERHARQYREKLRQAAKMGGQLFGPVPEGVRREFFCLNKDTWVWHEEWLDAKGERHVVTTRYDIRPNGVLKAQDGQPYRFIEKEEARRLYKAARMYNYLVHTQIATAA
jgi:hypothetical protein